MESIGKLKWLIPGGYIPLKSNGREPQLLSQDKIAVFNMNHEDVTLTMTVLYSNKQEAGPYALKVKARRVRKFRVNDFIDPVPVPLETDYSLAIEADKPVVVQLLRMYTGSKDAAQMGTIAFGCD